MISMVAMLVFALSSCDKQDELISEATGFVEEMAESEVSRDILSQVSANYPTASIEDVVRITGSDGSILIGIILDDGTTLTFEKGGSRCNDTIAIADLPQTLQTYIATEYPDEIIVKAVSMENDDGELIYHVQISSGEVLSFDESGTFIEVRSGHSHRKRGNHKRCAEEIDSADLLQPILDYLASDFSDETIEKAAIKEKRDGSIIYIVKLSSGEVLFFDEIGNLLEDIRNGWGE